MDGEDVLGGNEPAPALHLHLLGSRFGEVIAQLDITQFEERTVFYPIG